MSVSSQKSQKATPHPAVHFVAGGVGGMCGAIVTAPFDLVKTRLQSSLYSSHLTLAGKGGQRGLMYNFVETGYIIRDVYRNEGYRALYKGLGATLVGVVPSRSINFFMYGNGKKFLADNFNNGQASGLVHVGAAAMAGISTVIASNPIWVVKTRLQLLQSKPSFSASSSKVAPTSIRSFSHSAPAGTAISLAQHAVPSPSATQTISESIRPTALSTIKTIYRMQGIGGFYAGLSASVLGVSEGVIQWTLYEEFKSIARAGKDSNEGGWALSAAAGSAKLIATFITYPHEVVRTRLRQPPAAPGMLPKYHSLMQTFGLVLKEEGFGALYGGLTPHLLRVVPNAITMFFVYENVLKFSESRLRQLD